MNNLAVVHRHIGDNLRETSYALASYQQDPASIGTVHTLFRALNSGGQFRLIADIYRAFASPGRLQRAQHLNAALAFIRVNRTEEAKAALSRISDYPRHEVDDLGVAAALAGALSEHSEVLTLLDALGSLGLEIRGRRFTELFAAGEMEQALVLFKLHRGSVEDVARQSKLAMLSAMMIDDRATVAELAPIQSQGLQKFAEVYLSNQDEVEVSGRSRPYRFPFTAANFSISLRHAIGQFYEEGALRTLQNVLSPGDVVLDVGANIGNHAVFFAGEAACKVVAFECNPNLVARLRATVRLNQLEAQINLDHLGAAVSDKVGTSHFNFIREDFSNVSATPTKGTEPVPSITLDSLALTACRLLKIDVDGGELPVLHGADTLLRTIRPIVAIEVMNYNISAVLQLFSTYDYELVREDAGPQIYSDFVFAPREMGLSFF
ncbi:FkbM family methyltransferase [Phenylobacterium sp.]|uniref:FkbM family methyltransferase n=1 Tax=Phenylobacterium sp. TaxID=1871053 RepID=UPI00286D7BB4|nr:FkbM family methyltransferase [Phenylobacterium sp.]